MNKNLFQIRIVVVAAVILAPCAISASAADLMHVIHCMEERERSQDPVWYKYTIKTYMAAEYRKDFGKVVQKMHDRDLRDLQDVRAENTVEYARKGALRFQKTSGPKTGGKLFELVQRTYPSIFIFDGQRAVSFESPKYVQVSSQRGEDVTMLHGPRPLDVSGEPVLLDQLKSAAKGEVYDVTTFKDEEEVAGERLCRIELRAKKNKWRSVIYLYPTHSYALKSCEVISPEFGIVWKAHNCTYREIDGVAYLQSATHTSYGEKSKDSKERTPVKEMTYEAQVIETDARKFPDFRAEAKFDPDATYNDVDLKTTTSSPEQIQSVLDTIASLSTMSDARSASSSNRWLYAPLAAMAVAGMFTLVIVFGRRRRRRPVV